MTNDPTKNKAPLGFPPEIETVPEDVFQLKTYVGGIPQESVPYETISEVFAAAWSKRKTKTVPFSITNGGNNEILWEASGALLNGPRDELFESIRHTAQGLGIELV